jgi:hypothetical protein
MAARMSATKDLAKKIEEARKRKEKKAYGGRIGLKRGGIGSLIAQLMQSGMSYDEAAEAAEDYYGELEAPEDIREGVEFAEEGFKSAFGVESLFPQAPKPMGITPGFGNLPRMAEGGNVDIGKQFEEFLMKRQRGMQDFQREKLMEEFEKYMRAQDPTVEAAEGGMMDSIVDNMGEDFDYYTRLRIRELLKQGEDPEDVAEIAEQEAAERTKRKYTGKAEGGLMNLGGKEMDLRGGGFVPIGKKEKADDVPARLSKNEFVMTADAVRGAGNGDMNEGARRMYQTMDKLEAMV